MSPRITSPYNETLHIRTLTILFLMSLFNPTFNNSFPFINASFPIAICPLHNFFVAFCVVCYKAAQLTEFSDLLFLLSVDCYFHILIFCFFPRAYLSSLPSFLWFIFMSYSLVVLFNPSIISCKYVRQHRLAQIARAFVSFLLPRPIVLLGLVPRSRGRTVWVRVGNLASPSSS